MNSLTVVLEENMSIEWEAVWVYTGQEAKLVLKKVILLSQNTKNSLSFSYTSSHRRQTMYAILLGCPKGESPGSTIDNSLTNI